MNKKLLPVIGCLLAAVVSCNPATTPKAYIAPFLPTEKVQDNVQAFEPKVDILFVVDDSGSMGTHQNRLANNIDKFTSVFLANSVLDYNVGVISTSSEEGSYTHYRNCCGQLAGSVKVVRKTTVDADHILAANLILGSDGDGTERPFDAAYLALTEPNLSNWNKNFIRDEGSLVIIFITDAEDQSDGDGQKLFERMLTLKGGYRNRILAYGAIVPSVDTMNCERDEFNGYPVRIENFLSMFPNRRNNVMNLCDPDFGTKLAGLASDIVENTGRVILLNRAPQVDSIAVSFGNADLPQDPDKGWIFDPSRNAIILGKNIDWASQPAGSKIKVFYNAYKYDE